MSSLKKHIINVHQDVLSKDGDEALEWEGHCKIVKSADVTENQSVSQKRPENTLTPSFKSMPEPVAQKKSKKKKDINTLDNFELEEGAETTITQNKNNNQTKTLILTTEISSAISPPLTVAQDTPADPPKTVLEETKEEPIEMEDCKEKLLPTVPEVLEQKEPTDLEKRSIGVQYERCDIPVLGIAPQVPRTLDERIQEGIRSLPTMPTYPLESSEHHHIHCEYCGHTPLFHINHTDFIHDGELHYLDSMGKCYPHKLGISDANPCGCRPLLQYPWHACKTIACENPLLYQNEKVFLKFDLNI